MKFHEIHTIADGNNIKYSGVSFFAAENTVITGKCSFDVMDSGDVLAVYGMTLPEGNIYVGDKLGELILTYSDGSECVYPLTVGESLWWGDRFYKYCEPLTSDEKCNQVFRNAMKLNPCEPVMDKDGFVLYIRLENKELTKITYNPSVEYLPNIRAFTLIKDITDDHVFNFLEPQNINQDERDSKIKALQDIMCTNERNFPDHFEKSYPDDYIGPRFEFKGDKYADFYTNVLRYNLVDAAVKIDCDGCAHTSTFGAPWYGYDAIGGVYNDCNKIYPNRKPGFYYQECWSRDLGRSLIELVRLGRGENVSACIDWVFSHIKRWETDDTLLFEGKYKLPRHVQRAIQQFDTKVGNGCFENDGHALFSLAVWTFWKRYEDRQEWAYQRWEDIKALGDWYIWQFENPEISKATDLLWSDSEASGWPVKTGISFYVDYLAMEALRALSEIAMEQEDADSANTWINRADLLEKAIEKNYVGEDECWICACESPAWKGQTSLTHIICSCDRGSMDITKNIPQWNETDKRTGKTNCKNHDFHKNSFGYSNGFSIQSALLINEMEYATKFLRECAMMIYNPVISPYLIPEDAMRIREHMYARTGDLGNQVQQAEMLKALRIIIGIDDNNGELTISPRLPDGWDEVIVEDYPVIIQGKNKKLNYSYNKNSGKMKFSIIA